jgi:hypothetical protein
MDASVTERFSPCAPITRDIQGAQTTAVGLGTDKDDAVVETDAPVRETVHGKAPIIRDIRSSQTVIIGIGNDETEDETEERDAPVTETYGSKAPITKDIRAPQTFTVGTGPDGPTDAAITANLDEKAGVTVTSKSGVTLRFERAALTTLGGTYDLRVAGKLTISGNVDITIDAGGKIYIGNAARNMHEVLTGIIDQIEKLRTFGHPGMHKVDPVSLASLEAFKLSYINPLLNTSG